MTSTKTLLARIARRAEAEPDAVLPVLRVLAGEPPLEPPGAGGDEPDPALHAVALEINRARVARSRAEFLAGAWPTEQVARHLGVGSRQAVAQRRARGGLLGARVGAGTFYPAWQFGPAGLADGLDRLLQLLAEAGLAEARTADELLRMPHAELAGRTLLQVWQDGDWDTLAGWLGDIGGWQR